MVESVEVDKKWLSAMIELWVRRKGGIMNVIHILNWEYKVTCTKNYGDSGNDQLKMNKQEDK